MTNAQLKTVLRLSLVKMTPQTAEGVASEGIKMVHGLHIFKIGQPYRMIPKEQISIRFSRKMRKSPSPTVKKVQIDADLLVLVRSSRMILDINTPKTGIFDRLNKKYQVNFGRSTVLRQAEEAGEEVVLSLSRIEDVFGKVPEAAVKVDVGLLGRLIRKLPDI
jgi:hypothetical protein